MFKVVIPARFGASRLPGKPLIDIGGKPLVAHVWEIAKRSQADEVLIATDDQRVADACHKLGAETLLTSSDHQSGSDRIGEVARARGWPQDTIVVNLQGDEPCMPEVLVNQVAAALQSQEQLGIATLSAPLEDAKALFDPHVVKVVTDAQGAALYFSRAPIPWHRDAFLGDKGRLPAGFAFRRHIGLYAYRVGFLQKFLTWPPAPPEQIESLEQLRVLWNGERIQVEEAGFAIGPGVDTRDDLPGVYEWLGLASPD